MKTLIIIDFFILILIRPFRGNICEAWTISLLKLFGNPDTWWWPQGSQPWYARIDAFLPGIGDRMLNSTFSLDTGSRHASQNLACWNPTKEFIPNIGGRLSSISSVILASSLVQQMDDYSCRPDSRAPRKSYIQLGARVFYRTLCTENSPHESNFGFGSPRNE